jgi:hypothetical protein
MGAGNSRGQCLVETAIVMTLLAFVIWFLRGDGLRSGFGNETAKRFHNTQLSEAR